MQSKQKNIIYFIIKKTHNIIMSLDSITKLFLIIAKFFKGKYYSLYYIL